MPYTRRTTPTTPGTPAPTTPAAPAHTTGFWTKVKDFFEGLASFLVYPLVVVLGILVYLFCRGNRTALGILITIVVVTMMCVAFWFVAREKEASALTVPPPPADPSVQQDIQVVSGHHIRWEAGGTAWKYWDGTNFVDLP